MFMNINKAAILLMFTVSVFCLHLSSCKKEVLLSKELLVFLQSDIPGRATKTQTIPLVHTPVGVSGNKIYNLVAYATREVAADIEVHIQPVTGSELISDYNSLYKTNHEVLPAGSFKIPAGAKLKILSGASQSDPIQLEITQPEVLTNPNGYLLPIKIYKIETQDKGARISESHGVVYYKVTYEYNNIVQDQVPLALPNMSRTGWSVTVSNTTTGALGPAMLDGNNSTAWRSSNSATAAKWVVLNMGNTQTIKGFSMVPNYVALAENITQMTISSSNDNLNWIFQGTWKGSGPLAGTSATAPDIKGVNFISPVQGRYFRFEITSWVSGSRVGIGELNSVQ
jgi:hypothetical protein